MKKYTIALLICSFFLASYAQRNDGKPCPKTETVKDYDGNVYETVQIGKQCWMKSNLRTTHYADGKEVVLFNKVTFDEAARYSIVDTQFLAQYGYLYNWYAVMNGAMSSNANPSEVQGVCPDGWHVPSPLEWEQLAEYVNHYYHCDCIRDTDKTKSKDYPISKAMASNELWLASDADNCCAGHYPSRNNATGFSAYPAGIYFTLFYGVTFDGVHYIFDAYHTGYNAATFFTSSFKMVSEEDGKDYIAYYAMTYDNCLFSGDMGSPNDGISVRCVRN